ncbi:S-adenosyl-L-methionine-dependent methyltransferase [Pseudohyphozyma bogoriensis]|nr:S-adenosyl-L-methionine-dependent methyltransferase [Pseudohyphozyma bogoriensis]
MVQATPTGKDELKALLAVLTRSVNAIVEAEAPLPSLYDTTPAPPTLSKDSAIAVGAAAQIKTLLEGPLASWSHTLAFHVSSALRVVIEAHVVETIRESGKPEGLPVSEIAKSSAIDPAKLERILRLLAAHHIFVETSVGVFANNRVSVGFDTGRSVADLKAFVRFYLPVCVEDIMKGSPFVADLLLDPKTSHDYSPARNSIGSFDFRGLKDGAVVVDVGGGTGAVSLILAREVPQIKLVLQDRPEVINGETKAVWEKEEGEALSSGRVTLKAHDFFTPQPVQGADVYFLRAIIHDWPNAEAIMILKHLSAAATESTKLVLIEHIIEPLSWPHGAAPPELYPLLPSLGSTMEYLLDSQMMIGLNAQERRVEQYEELASASGWTLEKVYRGGKGCWDQMVFVKSK